MTVSLFHRSLLFAARLERCSPGILVKIVPYRGVMALICINISRPATARQRPGNGPCAIAGGARREGAAVEG